MIKGIQRIFSEVVNSYELVNHVLTMGLDIHWRRRAARQGAKAQGIYWLDVCSGTGEMARNLARLRSKREKIISVDFSYPMLSKALEKSNQANISFVQAEAKFLPFPDNVFDLVTISFATRNITPHEEYLLSHLKEFHRVLKPGAKFLNLETSQPPSTFFRKLFHIYIKLAVKPLGTFLSGSKAGYSYLAFTIPRFYSPQEFSSLLSQAGYKQVRFHRLLLGIAAIHGGVK
ncbi:MAG: ubiquinone/menaquinone biosynthesis methyltransferase [Candidatus Aminicenantes bacterium]